MTALLTLVLLMLTFVVIIVGRYYEDQAREYSPTVDCPDTEIKQAEAEADQ